MREITTHRGVGPVEAGPGINLGTYMMTTPNGRALWNRPPTRREVNRIARYMKRRKAKDGRDQVHFCG